MSLPIPQPSMAMPPAPIAGAGPVADMGALLAELRKRYEVPEPRKPMYPRGYRPPKKPEIERIWSQAMRARMNHQWLISRMYYDLMWLRMALVGTFPEDIEAKHNGLLIDEHRSPALAAEWETFCGLLSGLPLNPKKVIVGNEGKVMGRMMQDAAKYFLREEAYRHAESGNGVLRQEEAKYLSAYGRVVHRGVPYLADPDYPFRDALIDPTTFFPRFIGNNLERAYHVYRAPLEQIIGAYGDIPQREHDKLKNRYGSRWYEDETLVECVEYWDTWWRSVQCGECVILPVTATEYGDTPFTVGFGPSGEPMGSKAPPNAARWESSHEMIREGGNLYDDQVHKGLSYIHYMRVEHEQYEAIMARVVASLKKSVDPPTTLEQSNEAAMRERPELSSAPGAINELILGEQKWSPIPTNPNPIDVQTLMNGLMKDRMVTRLPDAMQGAVDQSNVSGTSLGNLSDAAMAIKASPWIHSFESWYGRKLTRKFRQFQNIGWQAKYIDADPTPLMVPMSRPLSEKKAAFELEPEMIDKIRPIIDVHMTTARKDQYNALANAGQVLNQMGIMTKEQIAEWFGNYDYDVTEEEWLEEKAIEMAMSNPDFAVMAVIPAMIEQQIEEADGNPRRQMGLRRFLLQWNQRMAAPMQQQQQMQQQQGMQQPPAGPQNPGVAGNVSYPPTGQGPGSVTGQMGGPGPASPQNSPNPVPPGTNIGA